MSADRDAYRLFLEDARAQGMTTREYEDAYGLVLLPSEREIEANEWTGGGVNDGYTPLEGRFQHCKDCAYRARVAKEEGPT